MKLIKQKKYDNIEIDGKEQDIVEIWMNSKTDSNVIQIERENLLKIINALINEYLING